MQTIFHFKKETMGDSVIFISGNTPSSKNGREWTGTKFIPSKYTRAWYVHTRFEWKNNRAKFKEMISKVPKPYFIHITLVRKSRHKFDYINIAQGPMDQMVDYKWLDDDDMTNAVPVFGKYEYNNKKPGMYIRVLAEPPKYKFVQDKIINNDIQTLTGEDRCLPCITEVKPIIYKNTTR